MRVLRRTLDGNFPVHQTAQRRGERRHVFGVHRRIGNDRDVGRELFAIALDRGVEVGRTDLLLALDDDFQVDRQPSARAHVCGDRGQVHDDLSFVVDGAAPEDLAVAHAAYERRSLPQIDRVDRLHVVVTVDEYRRFSGRTEPLAVRERISARLEPAGIEPNLAHAFDQAVATAGDFDALRGIGAYRGYRDEPFEFRESALLLSLAELDELRIDDVQDDGPSTNGSPNCTSRVLPSRSTSNACGLPS